MQRSMFLLMSAALAAPALAHPGPRIWIGSDDNTLVTLIGDNDTNPTRYTPQRVFIGGADEDTLQANGQLDEYPVPGTGIFATEFPAYQVRLDDNAGFGAGRTFGFNFTGPILVFNPQRGGWRTSQVTFGASSPAPQIGESAGNHSILSGDGAINGFDFYSYNAPSDHGHLVTTLYGDGTSPVDGPHVVYAVPMQLTGGGLATSQTYYVLYGRDVGLNDPAFVSAQQVANSVFPAAPGDANLDGRVNALDFNALADHFGQDDTVWEQGDFNFDAKVNTLDFVMLADNFGKAAVAAPALMNVAPEPGMLAALAIGLAGYPRRRFLGE